jgi:putative membrane protein
MFCSYLLAQNEGRDNFSQAQSESPAAHPTSPNDAIQRDNSNQRVTNERTDTSRRVVNRGERPERESNLERQLAVCVLTKNKGEVELGRYAAERAKSKDVKDFAEQIVKDHGQVVEKLEPIVGSQRPNDRRSQIAREIDEERLASLKRELSNKSDNEFDACYIGSQIAGHMEMAATLKVLSGHVSSKLSDVVNEARPTVDKHLADAKKIMENLDQSHEHAQAAKERSDRAR